MKKTSILLTVMAAIFSMAAYGQAPGRPAITPEYTPVHDPGVLRNRYWTPSPNGQSRPYPVTTDIPGLQI